MVRYNISLIPGDGVGPELCDATLLVLNATGVHINWEKIEIGEKAIKQFGTPLPDEAINSIKKNKIALKGPVTTPIGTGFRSVNVLLRKTFDLYACVRPCKFLKGVKSLYDNVDLVVIRENTEGLYAGLEFDVGSKEVQSILKNNNQDTAISLKIISKSASERVIKFAFEYAKKNNRKKVTIVTKANIMKYTDGLFLKVGKEIAKQYPHIEYEEKLIDNMCMQLVQKPEQYDVLVTTNLYGDILSDLCAGLVGGLGVAPGANIGKNIAIFEPVHGSAPKFTGQNRLNPMALILSAALMFEYLGEVKVAANIRKAVSTVVYEGKCVTKDLGGTATTTQMAEAIKQTMLEE